MPHYKNDSECRKHLEQLQTAFEQHLAATLSSRTVRKHSAIVGLFIDFLCFDCRLQSLDDITVGMANSYFRKWYLSKVGDATESELKAAIKKFFLFLHQEQGISNDKVLSSFKRK